MGICGGDGGGYANSTTSNQPWDVQAEYLRPLFKTASAGAFGWDPINDKSVEANDDVLDRFLGNYSGTGKALPGKLEYAGDKQGMWRDFDTLEGSRKGLEYGYNPSTTGLQMTAAPTVAGFSPEELDVQNIIKNRLKGETTYKDYKTGYDTLIPTATTALQNIVSGSNKINPASFSAANVSAPSTISKPAIGIPDSMSTPTIGSTDLGYRYWDDLGQMAGRKRNSYLEDMIGNAKENLWNDYTKYGVPGTDTTAEAAGRYGGNTWKELREDLYDKTSKNAGQIETAMRGEAYNADMNRALNAMNLGGTLATSQAGFDADRATRQATMEMERRSKEYDTSAAAKQLTGQLGLQADTAQAGNELTRNTQNALLSQEAAKEGAGYTQQANVQNVANVLQGAPIAPGVSQSDYEDIAKLAAVGESQSAKQQDIIDAFVKRFETNQNEPNVRFANMSNLLSGNFGGTTTSRAPATSSGGCF